MLGPFRVGDGARIGAAAVVLKRGAGRRDDGRQPGAARSAGAATPGDAPPVFEPYGVTGEIPDPIARALNGLLDEVTQPARAGSAKLERAPRRDCRASRRRATPAPANRRGGSACEGAAVKLSTKGRYAVMAMVDLARHSNGNPVSLAEIAERAGDLAVLSRTALRQAAPRRARQERARPGRRLSAGA